MLYKKIKPKLRGITFWILFFILNQCEFYSSLPPPPVDMCESKALFCGYIVQYTYTLSEFVSRYFWLHTNFPRKIDIFMVKDSTTLRSLTHYKTPLTSYFNIWPKWISSFKLYLFTHSNQIKAIITHCLRLNYYVNFLGGIDSNGFHIKWIFGTQDNWKN